VRKSVGFFRFDTPAEYEALAEVYTFLCPLYNVPAVYDVFAVAIKETVGFQQPQKCGGEKPQSG
jgi:hypothetical protein